MHDQKRRLTRFRNIVLNIGIAVHLSLAVSQAQSIDTEVPELYSRAEEHLRLGVEFFLTNELEIAIDEFHEAARLQPGYADAYHNLGVVLAKSGDLSGAIAAWSQAQRLDPRGMAGPYHISALVSYNYGIALLRQGQLDRAMAEWASALRIQPNFAEAHYAEGLGYLEKGNVLQAITKFQQALSWQQDWAMAHHQLGVAYYETREFRLADTEWRTALELDPQLAKTYVNIGLMQLLEEDVKSAIHNFQQALALDQNLPEAHFNLGMAYYHQREWQSAIYELQTVLTLRPQFLAALQLLGRTWAHLGQWGKAVGVWREALQTYPQPSISGTLHHHIGTALIMMGDVRSASEELKRALVHRPEWAETHYTLGTISMLAKEWGRALEHFQRVTELQPTWAHALFSLGKAQYHLGDVTQAIETLQETTELDPAFADAFYHLGVMLRAQNRSEEAIAPLQTAAKAGIQDAQSLLASMYANGSGVDKNIPMAMIWWARLSSTGVSTEAGILAKARLSQLRRQVSDSHASSTSTQEVFTGFSLIRQSLRQRVQNVDRYSYDQSLGQQLIQHGRVAEAVPLLIQEALALDEPAHTELKQLYLNGIEGKLNPHNAQILDYFLETALEKNPGSCEFLRKISLQADFPDSSKIQSAKQTCRLSYSGDSG